MGGRGAVTNGNNGVPRRPGPRNRTGKRRARWRPPTRGRAAGSRARRTGSRGSGRAESGPWSVLLDCGSVPATATRPGMIKRRQPPRALAKAFMASHGRARSHRVPMTEGDMRDGEDMPRGGWPDEAVTDIAARRDALRQAAGLPGADLRALMDGALTELDAAIDAARAAAEGAGRADDQAAELLPESVRTERRLLHAVFQQAPVPLFLLEQDGTIRRANNQAAALLGSPSGYATGKPLTAFVDLPFRATVQTQLAAVARTGRQRTGGWPLITRGGPVDVMLTAAAADLPGDPSVRIVTATRTAVPAVA